MAEEIEDNKIENSGDRYKTIVKVSVGDKVYSNLNGDIISGTRTKIVKTTYGYSRAEILLKDMNGSIIDAFSSSDKITIKIGFSENTLIQKFSGKIWSFGRILPDISKIVAVDERKRSTGNSFTTNSSSDSGISTSEEEKEEAAEALENVEEETDDTDDTEDEEEAIRENEDVDEDDEDVEDADDDDDDDDDIAFKAIKGISNLVEKIQEETLAKNEHPFHPAGRLSSLKIDKRSDYNFQKGGEVVFNKDKQYAALLNSIFQGETLTLSEDGETVEVNNPSTLKDSGFVLDYLRNKSVLIGYPEVMKRTSLQLPQTITVTSPDISNKTVNSVTVSATPDNSESKSTGTKTVPKIGEIQLESPIFEGCPYLWREALRCRDGIQDPESEEVVEGIVRIAEEISNFTKASGGEKWKITSWYRTPSYNLAIASSGANGPHTWGAAVDFWFPGLVEFHDSQDDSWEGGLAIHPAAYEGYGFVHIDLGGTWKGGISKWRRWSY